MALRETVNQSVNLESIFHWTGLSRVDRSPGNDLPTLVMREPVACKSRSGIFRDCYFRESLKNASDR